VLDDPAAETERLETGGRVVGWIGLAASVALVVVWLVRLGDPMPLPVLTGAVLAALLFWSAVLRPAVLVVGDDLVLRNMLETTVVPLAGIEQVALGQVLAVRAGDRRWVGSGVGRTLRKSALGGHGEGRLGQPGHVGDVGDLRGAIRGEGGPGSVDAADFVEARIADLAARARTVHGVERWSDEQLALGRTTRRTPAWGVVAALLVALVAFVVTCLL
jgi:hypothetical protein